MSKKIKYCKLCSPENWMIDKDSPVAVGYYLRGTRKVPVCELCASGQSRYAEIIYYDKKEEKEKICNHDIKNYEKKNLVTLYGEKGGYDILVCKICGYEKKRYGLGL